jgi:hypothetical protein
MQIKAAYSLKLLVGSGEGCIGRAQIVQVRDSTNCRCLLGNEYFRFCERSFV